MTKGNDTNYQRRGEQGPDVQTDEHAGHLSCPQACNCLILRPPGTVGQLYAIRGGGSLAGHQMSVLQCTAVYNQGLMPVMLAWQYSALSQYDILFL